MTHYQLVAKNKRKSLFVMAGFILFVIGAAYAMSVGLGYGPEFIGAAFIFSGVMSFASYWFSDKIILSISGAQKADRQQFFDFYTVAENLAASQRMPLPELYVIPDSAPNAFATGRDPNHAVVVATTGLLSKLNRSEIEGVVAHELAHVQNYDIRLMSIVSILVGMLVLLSDWLMRMSFFGGGGRDRREGGNLQAILAIVGLILVLISPIIANLIKLAISRKREFLADASAAAMTKNPEGLARALEKISRDHEPLEAANKATAHLYIASPLKDAKGSAHWFAQLFMTHPPVEERIAALRNIAK